MNEDLEFKKSDFDYAGQERRRPRVFGDIQWTDKNEETINLTETFILVDRIHQWIVANQDCAEVNYLTLTCTGGVHSDKKWVASFDSNLIDDEWFEHIEIYPFAAHGSYPEEAIFRAALRVKEFVGKL